MSQSGSTMFFSFVRAHVIFSLLLRALALSAHVEDRVLRARGWVTPVAIFLSFT